MCSLQIVICTRFKYMLVSVSYVMNLRETQLIWRSGTRIYVCPNFIGAAVTPVKYEFIPRTCIFAKINKANLRDLIAATGLVILLKLDWNQFFSPCDLEVWWMTSKNNRPPLPYYVKFCASFQIHRLIQTGFAVWKRSIRVKIADFASRVTLKFDGRHWKTIGHLCYAASSFVHHFIAIIEFKLELQSGNAKFGSKLAIFCPLWPLNLMDDHEKQ